MLYGVNKLGVKVEPSRDLVDAYCPYCGCKLIAKCGDINRHHWAHVVDSNCKFYGENEGEWHLNWKRLFNTDFVEVQIGDCRADVVCGDTILEFQDSTIDVNTIKDREFNYDRRGYTVLWIVNLNDIDRNRIFIRDAKYDSLALSIKYPRKHINYMTNIYFNLDGKLYEVVNEKRYYKTFFVKEVKLALFYYNVRKYLKCPYYLNLIDDLHDLDLLY